MPELACVDRKRIFDSKGLASFAENLKKIRNEKKVTQEQLAYLSGLSLSQIARIETVQINPTLSTVFILCRALEVHPTELFDGVEL